MTDKIEIPAGISLWLRDRKTKAAIDALADKPAAPEDLAWEDYPKYVEARLTTTTVLAHHAILLHRVWQATWGKALQAAGLPISEGDWQSSLGNTSPEDVWERCLTADIENGTKTYSLSATTEILAEQRCGILIGFFSNDDDYEWSDGRPLDATEWMQEPEDHERWTRNDLVELRSTDSNVSLTPLVSAAQEVADLISKRV